MGWSIALVYSKVTSLGWNSFPFLAFKNRVAKLIKPCPQSGCPLYPSQIPSTLIHFFTPLVPLPPPPLSVWQLESLGVSRRNIIKVCWCVERMNLFSSLFFSLPWQLPVFETFSVQSSRINWSLNRLHYFLWQWRFLGGVKCPKPLISPIKTISFLPLLTTWILTPVFIQRSVSLSSSYQPGSLFTLSVLYLGKRFLLIPASFHHRQLRCCWKSPLYSYVILIHTLTPQLSYLKTFLFCVAPSEKMIFW